VTDQQLSLAIGKKGQNVRLAAKLSNWKIDIISETDYELKRAKEKEIEISQSMAREMGVEQELANENPESSNEESLT
jgi:N utilization substance protein A